MAAFARDLLGHKYFQDCNGGDKKVGNGGVNIVITTGSGTEYLCLFLIDLKYLTRVFVLQRLTKKQTSFLSIKHV